MTDKKRGRPRKDIRAGDIGREIIDAFYTTLAEMEDAVETASKATRDPKSVDDPVRRGFMRVRELTKRFEEQTGKDFRRLSKLLLSVLQSRDDTRLLERRAKSTRQAKGRTVKKYFEDGLTAEMCPMGPSIIADNEADAKELRSRLEGLPVHVRVSGTLIPEGEMTVNARDLQHLYRVPVSVHLNCPDDYRAEIMPVIVNEWRRIRDACNFKGIHFRNKPKSITNRNDNSDARRIYVCLQACQQADEQRGERHDEKTGKLHKQAHQYKLDPQKKIDNAERSATQAPPETGEEDYDMKYVAARFCEVIDAVPEDVRPVVQRAVMSVIGGMSADRETFEEKNTKPPNIDTPDDQY